MIPTRPSQLVPPNPAVVALINGQLWYRAVLPLYWRDPLGYNHTYKKPSRFSAGKGAYPLLYLAPDPITALLEVQALIRLAKFYLRPPSRAVPSYGVFSVRVNIKTAMDFGDPSLRQFARYTAQELTGDWRTYVLRNPLGPSPQVRSATKIAPTQALGNSLAKARPDLEGFLSPSAVRPTVSNLVLFPDRLSIDSRNLTIESK